MRQAGRLINNAALAPSPLVVMAARDLVTGFLIVQPVHVLLQ